MKKYKILPFTHVSIPLETTDDLLKLLLVLDIYDVSWIQGQRPLEYTSVILQKRYLRINNKSICLRETPNYEIKKLEEVLQEL